MTFVSRLSKQLEHKIKRSWIKRPPPAINYRREKNKWAPKFAEALISSTISADVYCLNDRTPTGKHPVSYNFEQHCGAVVH